MTRNPAAQQHGLGVGAGVTRTPVKRGAWTPEEDELLSRAVAKEGEGRWRTLPRRAGLLRCGKSCRLRWMNYLRPDIKRGPIAADEEDLILRLHRLLGNRWSLIAGRLPGRTDNEIKNYWNSQLSKKLIARGIDPRTHTLLPAAAASPHSHRAGAAAAAVGSTDKTPPLPEEVEPQFALPPPPAHPTSPSGAGVGGDFSSMMVLDAEGFDGLGDPFCAPDVAARGGFDLGCPIVDDATFSLFLDSLMNDEERIADYFGGDHKDADGENDDKGGAYN